MPYRRKNMSRKRRVLSKRRTTKRRTKRHTRKRRTKRHTRKKGNRTRKKRGGAKDKKQHPDFVSDIMDTPGMNPGPYSIVGSHITEEVDSHDARSRGGDVFYPPGYKKNADKTFKQKDDSDKIPSIKNDSVLTETEKDAMGSLTIRDELHPAWGKQPYDTVELMVTGQSKSHIELLQLLQGAPNSALKTKITTMLNERGIVDADIQQGTHVQVLRHLCLEPGRVVELAQGDYQIVGDVTNPDHLLGGVCPPEPNIHRDLSETDGRRVWFAGEYQAAWRAYGNWKPTWRPGYGPLQMAAGVILEGKEGVVFSGNVRVATAPEGASFRSIHLSDGVEICQSSAAAGQEVGGSHLRLLACTSTGFSINVENSQTLEMEDCRVFNSIGRPARPPTELPRARVLRARAAAVCVSGGVLIARRCHINANNAQIQLSSVGGQGQQGWLRTRMSGVSVYNGPPIIRADQRWANISWPSATIELVDCIVEDNGKHGVLVKGRNCRATLQGGTITRNGECGVCVNMHSIVEVVGAGRDLPQTVSDNNGPEGTANWHTRTDGVILGLEDTGLVQNEP